jgi:hypothetical protein
MTMDADDAKDKIVSAFFISAGMGGILWSITGYEFTSYSQTVTTMILIAVVVLITFISLTGFTIIDYIEAVVDE